MDIKFFTNKTEFETFMKSNYDQHPGFWIKFDKGNTQDKLKPEEALDIALCYGWIDGLIKRIDDDYYMKYFAKRLDNSVWSTKNMKSVERLIQDNRMTKAGLLAVDKAKKDGRWDKADLPPLDYSLDDFIELIKFNEIAYQKILKLPKSIQKNYAMSYYTLKKQDSKNKRLTNITRMLSDEKLNENQTRKSNQ